jgi:hypothetical protein
LASELFISSESVYKNQIDRNIIEKLLTNQLDEDDKENLLLHRFNVPNVRGNQSLNIFQKLHDSLTLYCEFLVDEGFFIARNYILNKKL